MPIEPSDLMNGLGKALQDNGDGTFSVKAEISGEDVTINASDIEIGAVEIKDATSDTRAVVDFDGVHTVVMSPWLKASSTELEASHVIKAAAGTLQQVLGYNANTSDQFIQVYNLAAVPADTAVPVISTIARAQSNFCIDLGESGCAFSTGICISNSSTAATKTIGSADCFFYGQYK